MPVKSWTKVKENGLHIAYSVKKDDNGQIHIYPCPVQGDINFLVKTAFLMRKNVKPVNGWKSPATTPVTVKACFEQDRQEGLLEFINYISLI